MSRAKKNQEASASYTNTAPTATADNEGAPRKRGAGKGAEPEAPKANVLVLADMLSKKGGVSVAAAAEALSVTEAKVRFMIDRLRRQGATITALGKGVFEKGGTGARPRNRDGSDEDLKAALAKLN